MDVLLFRRYISTVLDYAYGVFKRDSHEEFDGLTNLARRSLVTIAVQRRAVIHQLSLPYGVFGTTGQVVPTSGQVVETTCECSVVSTTDFYQLSGSVQLQI